MSFRALLKHRCTLVRLKMVAVNGSPISTWEPVEENVRCFIDLNFIRKGKDPFWTEQAGRPADRTGVLFLLGDTPIKSGDRVIISKGPKGSFSVEGAIDEVWTPSKLHHLEVGVREVATQLARGAQSNG